MKLRFLPLAVICLLVMHAGLRAQSTDVPKFEVAGEFTTLGRDTFSGERWEAGFGGRFTFNLNENFALETAGYLFPSRCFDCLESGHMAQAVGGVKFGKRFDTWGIFAKARPGIVTFSEAQFSAQATGGNSLFTIDRKRTTSFATDIGGVLEFYPSRRIVTRFDFGDTIMFIRDRVDDIPSFDPTNGTITIIPIPRPARTSHHFQFSASVGFRF